MKFTTYLFDFDGTLVDSMPTFVSAMLKILDENNIKYQNDVVKIITPLGYQGTARYFKTLGLDMEETKLISLMKDYMLCEYQHNIEAKPYVIEILKKLKEKGANFSILTASPHAILDDCLKRLGIYYIFENVWSTDDFGTNKSDPRIFIMAAERMKKPVEEILFLDDNYEALKTAKSSNMSVCGVFDETSKDYIDDIKSVADYYIYDFLQLSSINN